MGKAKKSGKQSTAGPSAPSRNWQHRIPADGRGGRWACATKVVKEGDEWVAWKEGDPEVSDEKTCWGCGAPPPPPGEPQHTPCPKCALDEKGHVSETHVKVFCSEACRSANWARHMRWHAKLLSSSTRLHAKLTHGPAATKRGRAEWTHSMNNATRQLEAKMNW